MARENFQRCMTRVFQHEGGFTDDKRDPGNWTGGKVGVGELKGTNFGIAANSYPNEDIRNLTKARATALYRRDYWERLSCDELPAGLDYAVLDYGINSGTSRAAKELQRMFGGVRVDGVLGEATIAKARDCLDGPGGVEIWIGRYCDARLAFMKSLKTWATYGKGWQRRVTEVRRISMSMVEKSGLKAPKAVDAVNASHNDKAVPADRKMLGTAENQAAAATASGTAGATGIGTIQKLADTSSEVASSIEPVTYYLDWAMYAFVALMVLGAGFSLYLTLRKSREG